MVYHVIGNDEPLEHNQYGAPPVKCTICILLAYYKVVYKAVVLVIFEGIAGFFYHGQYNW